MRARCAIGVLAVAACGSRSHVTTDSRSDAPPLGDCHCDGSGSGSDGRLPDASIDAPTCNTAPSCPAGQWCTETAPVAATVILNGVWAIDNNDVFAVGNGGTILRRRCNTWTAMTSGTTQNLHAVWASPTDVWAVGDAGTILRFDGTQWNAVTGVTTGELDAVSGVSANDVWIVGAAGQAFRWNGTSWTTRGVGGFLLAVAGTSDSDVWTTGEASYVRDCNDPALWTNTTPWPTLKPEGNAGSPDYYALVERSATNVWVSSGSRTTWNYNGSTWTQHTNGSSLFHAMFARSDTDIWGAGETKVGRWNGSVWAVATPTGVTTQQLFGVTGTATDVWVVGDNATILHQD